MKDLLYERLCIYYKWFKVDDEPVGVGRQHYVNRTELKRAMEEATLIFSAHHSGGAAIVPLTGSHLMCAGFSRPRQMVK